MEEPLRGWCVGFIVQVDLRRRESFAAKLSIRFVFESGSLFVEHPAVDGQSTFSLPRQASQRERKPPIQAQTKLEYTTCVTCLCVVIPTLFSAIAELSPAPNPPSPDASASPALRRPSVHETLVPGKVRSHRLG